MIEEALIVAELDTALYRQHNRWHAVRKENGKLIDCARELSALLAHPAEKRQLNPTPATLEALMDCLTAWGMRHELLQLLLMGMDAVCSDDTRLAALALVEQLLEQAEVANFARARLFGCPLPAVADLDTAVILAARLPKTQSLYQDLHQAQGIIPVVRRTLENLLRFDFELSCAADDLLPAMIDVGLVAAAVNALSHQDKNQIENLLFTFAGNQVLKTLEPRLSQLLTLFIKQLLTHFTPPAKAVIAPTTRYDDDPIAKAIEAWKTALKQPKKPDKHKKTADQSRQNNDKQKDYIIKLIQQGKHAQIQTALLEMVLNHRQTGDLKHLCKSLSDLAARTVALGQPELAVDFYHYAKLANNLDVVVYTGYAETLRALNRLEEALNAYAAAKQQFPKDAVCHNGYAETLRALNRLEEALNAYAAAKQQFPNDAVCHNGYAETLRALNRLGEALTAYEEAKQQFPNNAVCHTGHAETLRALNRLDDALTAYAAAKKQFPNNAVCHTGYAETLRALGRNQLALQAYDAAQLLFPNDPVLLNAKACLLISLERYTEARELLSVYGLDSGQAYRDYHVLAMSYFYEGDFTTAENMLRRGVKDASGHDKAVFENALAVLLIKQHKANEVLQLWQSKVVSPISLPQQNVVYAHALAECHYLNEADAQLKQLEKPPTPVFELSQFLLQRYWSANSPAEQAQLDETIFRRELDLMLYAA